jgi:hypothetical protein
MFTEAQLNEVIILVGQATALVLTSGAIGVAFTPIISYIKTALGLNEPGNITLKRVVAVLTSLAGGCLATIVIGHFLFTTIVSAVISTIIVFVSSYKFYQTLWKESEAIKKIEGTY